MVQFLTSGAVNAAVTDNSVTISSILATNPGNAVKKAANAALDAGTPQALYDFLSSTFEKARLEDDSVAVSTLLANAGPYTKAHAQAAMEGPAWMRRNLLAGTQYQIRGGTPDLECPSKRIKPTATCGWWGPPRRRGRKPRFAPCDRRTCVVSRFRQGAGEKCG
ncbi:ALF repeat-containing protein [Streptomyces sp. NPDC006703]|uniref:ALF repeat-containing protein n=1 Tax=Streptomyces sp. NPDC006703 TaxID=3364759 RepID=UPI0036BC13D6